MKNENTIEQLLQYLSKKPQQDKKSTDLWLYTTKLTIHGVTLH